jgi:twitching motility two-component system response regulator PilG
MNNEIATYTIGVIGFERSERRVLRRVVGMADSRQPAFKPFDKNGGGCPHLIMVDADRPSAMHSWDRFRRANAHRASFSPIFVGRSLTDLPCPDPYVLQRPILTTRLFAVLDQAVAEVHGFRPAASILDGIVALTQHEIDTTLETTTVLAASVAVTHAESDESSWPQRAPEVNALVVDDSLPVRVQMRGALSSIASRVDFAETGERALELIDAHRYSIIFLDGTLPDEDAYELCGRIKKHPLQREAVVVMLTSSSSPADRVMGLLAGFDNYLVKPIQRAMFNGLAADLVRPAAAI